MAKTASTPPVPPAWEKYINSLARKYATGMFGPDDVRQTAYLAYFRALKRHDPAKGPLENYAKAAIRNALISARRAEQRHLQNPGIEGGAEANADAKALPWTDEVSRLEIEAWLARLSPPLARTCRGIYFDKLSQADLAGREGVSQPRISQRHAELLAQGREDLDDLSTR
jgi:RNA polymerase sigma factor (sigma-70 family)